jgi:regulator of protease activity HflC (stomatin/prohibitin superfamily)
MSTIRTITLRKITVRSTERALEYVDGVCTRVLEPGRHRIPRRATYQRVWMVERIETTAPQDVLTSDGVSVRVTAAVRWAVGDPLRFAEAAADPMASVYLAVQIALREALVDVETDTVVRQSRRVLGAALTPAAVAAGLEVGIAVREVVVKDVILPPDLRSAYAEQVTARARGQARLEAARAETAALRSLANGAKLLDQHPALARQRLVELLPPGSTLELSTGE